MIIFNHVSAGYEDTVLLNDVSFHVKQQEKAVIIGRSGSGKSSLLNILAGFMSFTGDVFFGQSQLTAQARNVIRGQFVYIGQEPILAAPTVKEAIDLPFSYKQNQHISYSDTELQQWLEMFHLPQDILRQRGDNLSGGEKQRVAIIRALLMKKKYMLADEITSALDEQSTKLIMQILWQQEDLTILSVSHDPTWIEACNPILKLENKKIIRQEK